MARHDIIVIGASAGGIEALEGVFSGLPHDLPAAIFITQHLPADPSAILPRLLDHYGLLPVAYAQDGEAIRSGKVYLAPPDYHLILEPGFVRLSHGPRENLQRPCINAMFRSAATHYGERVCGVLLSGLLDDGAAGLWEIQQRDGIAVVQDPDEARYRSMPESAIRGLTIQYIVRAAEMGPLLARLAMTDNGVNSGSRPAQACVEPGGQSCPDCGGVMVTARLGGLLEYRCHTGHRLGLATMIAEKHREVELALDIALSQSEELTTLLRTALDQSSGARATEIGNDVLRRLREQEVLRELLGYTTARERDRCIETHTPLSDNKTPLGP